VLWLAWYTADSIRDSIRTKINDSQVPRCKVSRIGLSVDVAYECCGWRPSETDRHTGCWQRTPCKDDGDGAVNVQLHVDTASWAAIRRHTPAAWHWHRHRPWTVFLLSSIQHCGISFHQHV